MTSPAVEKAPQHASAAQGRAITVRELASADHAAWTAFLATRSDAVLYHTLPWRDFVVASFRHEPLYLIAERGAQIAGILPMFVVRNAVLGSKLLSLPYDMAAGGALAVDEAAERALYDKALAAARSLRVDYAEFRSDRPRPELSDLGLPRSEPVLITQTPLGDEAVWDRVAEDHVKARRKAAKRGVTVREAASREDYAAFYDVYLTVFRTFGTPPYGWRYFDLLFERFHADSRVKLLLAFAGDRCIGGLQLFCYQRNLVSKFAACLPEAVPLRAYAALYGAAIDFGLAGAYANLNWGSSSRAQEGLIRFKEGWGATTSPAQVYALPIRGAVPDVARYYDADGIAQRAWRKLPVAWTRVLGPPLNRWYC